jgi:hypothetical protein
VKHPLRHQYLHPQAIPTPPPTPMTDSKTNPLTDFINSFKPVADVEMGTSPSSSMETEPGGYDYPGTERHSSTPVSEVCDCSDDVVRVLVVAMISIGFIVLTLFVASKSAGGMCPDPKHDFRPYWKYNNSVFNNTGESVCHSSKALIDRDHRPVAVNLPGRDHCETIYYLGQSDYVYVCRYDGDFSVVFTTITNNETNDSVEVALSWRQYCSLMFLSDKILYDLNFVMFSI